jgi:hypothetical protein
VTGGNAAEVAQRKATAAIGKAILGTTALFYQTAGPFRTPTLSACIPANKTPTNIPCKSAYFMPLVTAATKIPWKEILRYGPPAIKALHDTIKQILNRPKRSPSDSLDSRVTEIERDLRDSLRALEAASEQGAKRIQELAAAGQILSRRITIALAVAFFSAILAIGAVVLALIYRA